MDTAPHSVSRLQNLKEEIRRASERGMCKLVENYKSADEVATILQCDLKNAIEQDFPLLSEYVEYIVGIFWIVLFDIMPKRRSSTQKGRAP